MNSITYIYINSRPVCWYSDWIFHTGSFFTQVRRSKYRDDAENILTTANEEARNIQLQAKDKALEIRQSADAEIARRRSDS